MTNGTVNSEFLKVINSKTFSLRIPTNLSQNGKECPECATDVVDVSDVLRRGSLVDFASVTALRESEQYNVFRDSNN